MKGNKEDETGHNKKEDLKSDQLRTLEGKKRMLESLSQSMGIVEGAVKKAGVARSTHYRWLEEDKEYSEAVFLVGEMAVDMAESELLKHIQGKNLTAIIFYLKTKGKHRGYIERIENEQRNVNDFSEYTDEELQERLKRLRDKRVN